MLFVVEFHEVSADGGFEAADFIGQRGQVDLRSEETSLRLEHSFQQ